MTKLRRQDREITDSEDLKKNIKKAKYVTLAMCSKNEPYLVSLSHGFDQQKNCIYFHCAMEGKKIEVFNENNLVWGQALVDGGYVQGSCRQLFSTTQFRGRVTIVNDEVEKEHGLQVLIEALENNPKEAIKKHVNQKAIEKVTIGRIDIDFMSGKKVSE